MNIVGLKTVPEKFLKHELKSENGLKFVCDSILRLVLEGDPSN